MPNCDFPANFNKGAENTVGFTTQLKPARQIPKREIYVIKRKLGHLARLRGGGSAGAAAGRGMVQQGLDNHRVGGVVKTIQPTNTRVSGDACQDAKDNTK